MRGMEDKETEDKGLKGKGTEMEDDEGEMNEEGREKVGSLGSEEGEAEGYIKDDTLYMYVLDTSARFART